MANSNHDSEDLTDIAALLRPLGDPTRLRIFQFLRRACCPLGACSAGVVVDEATGAVRCVSGPTVGEICCYITGSERVTSTLSEHLRELRIAGLIVTERRGRNVLCAVRPEALAALAAFFSDTPSLSGEAKGTCDDECCC